MWPIKTLPNCIPVRGFTGESLVDERDVSKQLRVGERAQTSESPTFLETLGRAALLGAASSALGYFRVHVGSGSGAPDERDWEEASPQT